MWGLESEGGWGGWLGGCGAMQMMQWEDDALVRRAREIVSEQWPRLENNEIDEIVAVLIKAVVGFVNPCKSGVSHQLGNPTLLGIEVPPQLIAIDILARLSPQTDKACILVIT